MEDERCRFRIWVYVPTTRTSALRVGFPICQTYVDVVVGGCLAWGGESLALASSRQRAVGRRSFSTTCRSRAARGCTGRRSGAPSATY